MTGRQAWKIVAGAFIHFNDDDGWAMASHVALSTLLAIFPFLIFGASLASFVGADAYADTAVHIIFDTWPKSIAEPIARQVLDVLTVERSGFVFVHPHPESCFCAAGNLAAGCCQFSAGSWAFVVKNGSGMDASFGQPDGAF